jgi:hypothetical protein
VRRYRPLNEVEYEDETGLCEPEYEDETGIRNRLKYRKMKLVPGRK